MPRPTLPPTPGSSTDINGQDGTKHLAGLQLSFELPPPALVASDPQHHQTAVEGRPSRYPPLQASEVVKSRRRGASTAASTSTPQDQFALPPPPTRTRKIIQMKPRSQQGPPTLAPATKAPPHRRDEPQSRPASRSGSETPEPSGTTTGSSKRKQGPTASSAAGRKMARKTAHSLIERRRRSKMNEEFGTLKDMVPACTGEMHKLAILQATIDYVRYLEDCVAQLKVQAQRDPEPRQPDNQPAQPYTREPHLPGDVSPYMEPTMPEPGSPALDPYHTQPASHQPPSSPAANQRLRQDSQSSSVSIDGRDFVFTTSASTSPAFGPQAYQFDSASATASMLTSPALAPQRDVDHEASSALLTLSRAGRSELPGFFSSRGMSVKDLLTP